MPNPLAPGVPLIFDEDVSPDHWQIGEARGKRKTVTEDVASSTTLQNDDHLFFTIGSSGVWVVEYRIRYTGSTVGDIKFSFSLPPGATGKFTGVGLLGAASGGGDVRTFTLDAAATESSGALGITTSAALRLDGLIAPAGTGGTVNFQWAQQTSEVGATSILSESYLLATRIA